MSNTSLTTKVSQSRGWTLALGIGTLTQLVVGALRPEVALRSGLAEGDLRAAQALAALGGGYITFMPSSDYF